MADILPADWRTVCFHYHTCSMDTQTNHQAVGSPVSEKSRLQLEDAPTVRIQLVRTGP